MTLNFGEVLTRAWQITWRYKILWLFGILAGCNRSSGGGSSSNYQVSQDQTGPQFQQFEQWMEQAGNWMTENWWIFVLLILVALVLIAVSIFLGTIGRIGLIRGTLQAEGGAASLSFSELFSGSLRHFWPVFGLSLLIGIIFAAIIGSLVVAGIVTAGIGFLCLAPVLCIIVPVTIAVNLILEQAFVAIVKENLGIVDGWKRGLEVARANIGPILLMGIILFVIGLVAGVLIALPAILIVVPSAIAFAAGQGQDMTPLMIAGVLFLVYLPILLVLQGILNTYMGSAWTLTYLRLTAPKEDNTPTLIEANA
jgi:hypothetical protein